MGTNKVKISKSSFSEKGIFVDSLGKNAQGHYVARKMFYYTQGRTALDFANQVALHPDIEILSHGEVRKPFRGGASVANSSHWYVTFKLK